MLETKDLVKIYKPKKGVPVTALDKVSVKFPDRGMVFLLGKSGSGKSTLLNVLGGLDKYNSGEIIIKGVSSKNFKQRHFDSYRNTYVGFIFQEYNILDEFSVGANIALAVELQNRKATDDEVNRILNEVDLSGFGNRKPNELSGGQKQRVAIARALVKNPQIIMADEPTGALDSNTGKAIFDTLKKLSKEKLVIVVSHDREFAEIYADRIIELSDGKIISDVERVLNAEDTADSISFSGNTVEIPSGYHITEEDRQKINEYISCLKSGNLKMNILTRNSANFKNTDLSKIKSHDGSTFKLIKSKLPLKNAFKIGSGALKYKKIRLVITILLCCISFGLFGLSDTFGSYNHIKTCTNSIYDTGIEYLTLKKSKLIAEGENSYWRTHGYALSREDIAEIEVETGVKIRGVYVPAESDLSFSGQINPKTQLTESNFEIYNTYFNGFSSINEKILSELGFSVLEGALPDSNKNEIAISEYIFEVFKKAGYTDMSTVKNAKGEDIILYQQINSYGDIIGKTLTLNNIKYTVTAVIDTNFDITRYIHLIEKKTNQSNAEELVDYVLFKEFNYAFENSYASIIMTGEGYLDRLIASAPKITAISEGYLSFYGNDMSVDSNYLARLEDVSGEKIFWLDSVKTSLSDKEIIVTTDVLHFWEEETPETQEMIVKTQAELLAHKLKNKNNLAAYKQDFNYSEGKNEEGYKIVGIIDIGQNNSKLFSTVVCSQKLFEEFTDGTDKKYDFAVGAMPESREDINRVVSFCYNEDGKERYPIQNSVTYELDSIDEVLKTLSRYFLYIGLGFAAFAALMLANFIGTSISYKKQEIGILRAIGSRSNDVFRIFFAESFIIAIINFLLSALGVLTVTLIINHLLRNEIGILITVLSFGIRQVLLLFAVSVAVAFTASYLPVKRIASKSPIDAMRNR